jgi:flagellar basal-body rod protein FlgB
MDAQMPNPVDRLFGVHAQALTLRSQRSSVLAANMANGDTPNYKAKDIDFQTALKQAKGNGGANITKTHSRHIDINNTVDNAAAIKYRNPLQASLDGNTVDTHLEQTRFADNNVHYQATLHFLNSKISGVVKALRGE